jgi:hypothetical protein
LSFKLSPLLVDSTPAFSSSSSPSRSRCKKKKERDFFFVPRCIQPNSIKLLVKVLSLLLETGSLALEKILSVKLSLKLRDNELRRVQRDLVRGTVKLSLGDLLDINAPSLSVDLGNLALVALERASDDDDLIVLLERNSSDVVLGAQVLGKVRREELPADVGRSLEVGLSGLSARAGNFCKNERDLRRLDVF